VPSAELNRKSGVPLYRQIMEILRDEIASGELDSSTAITEAKLLARFDVSLAPIRQALNELRRDGLLYRQQGKGTFPVSGVKVDRPADLKTGDLYRYLSDRGLHPTSTVSDIEWIEPPVEIGTRLDVRPGEKLMHFTRRIDVDAHPFAHNDVFVRAPKEFAPTLTELADGGSALALLEERHGIRVDHAEHEAWATRASNELGALLGVDPGSPLLVIDTVFFSPDGTPVGWRSARHRPEEFKFHFVSND